MNFLRTSGLKKTSAVVLFILFTAVHAVKAFHSHELASTANKTQNNTVALKALFNCSICDFHIAKDSDAETFFADVIPPSNDQVANSSYAKSIKQSVSLVNTVRGPPIYFL